MDHPAKKTKTESLEELRERGRRSGVPEEVLAAVQDDMAIMSLIVQQAEFIYKGSTERLLKDPPEMNLNDERIKENDEIIKEADERIKEADERIKEQDERIKEQDEFIYKGSTERLLKDPPEMELTEREFTSFFTEQYHAGNTKHREATSNPREVNLQSVKPYNALVKFSSLLLKLHKNSNNKGKTDRLEATYSTKRDVLGFVSAALDDAQCLAEKVTGKYFNLFHGFSLWSNQCEHLVLYDHADKALQCPILAVEVQKPFEKEMSKHHLGQMFDHLMDMRRRGHSAPFVVSSTFEKSWLFWGDDKESNRIVGSEDRLEEVKAKIGTDTKPAAAKKKTPSPSELKNETNHNSSTDSLPTSMFKECARKNNMFQSKAYGSKQLVPLLYNAIICGLARSPTVFRDSDNHSSDRNSYDGIALHLTQTSYDWGHLNCSLGCPIGTRRNFFAIENLGRGDTSKVFDAYDSSGNRCVIKMYIKVDEESSTKYKQTVKESCKREVERLQTFYLFLKDKVYFQELNKFPCVIMPYFRPLSKKERNEFLDENGKLRSKIRACLLALAKQGLKYHGFDLRWRHIGYYEIENKKKFEHEIENRKKVVMFNLADLEEMNEEEKKDLAAFVGSQIESLLNQCDGDR